MPDLRSLKPGDEVTVVTRLSSGKRSVRVVKVHRVTPTRIYTRGDIWNREIGYRISRPNSTSDQHIEPVEKETT